MPTMMSARPRRSISSRTAGVSAVAGIDATVPPSVAGRPTAASAFRDSHRRPARIRLARSVPVVRLLVGEHPEPEVAPRAEPRIDRRRHVDPDPDQGALDDDAVEEAFPLL